jgi:hypothetical protein
MYSKTVQSITLRVAFFACFFCACSIVRGQPSTLSAIGEIGEKGVHLDQVEAAHDGCD